MNKQTGLDLISIIRHVLHQETAPIYDHYEDIYKLAKFHDVLGISYLGIKDHIDISDYKEWKKAYEWNHDSQNNLKVISPSHAQYTIKHSRYQPRKN